MATKKKVTTKKKTVTKKKTTAKKKVVTKKKAETKKKVATKKAGGRPSSYSDELADKIVELRLAGNTITRVCEVAGVSISTLWRWLDEKPEFWKSYARATQIMLNRQFEEIEQYADELLKDTVLIKEIKDRSGNPDLILAFDNARVSAAKLRVDTRRWRLGNQLGGMISKPNSKKKDKTKEASKKFNVSLLIDDDAIEKN